MGPRAPSSWPLRGLRTLVEPFASTRKTRVVENPVFHTAGTSSVSSCGMGLVEGDLS